MSNQRQHPRTPMKCRIKISHPDLGDVFGHTRDLSDGGVFVVNADLATLPPGTEVRGQVQDMPIEAPVLRMMVQRVIPGEGAGMAFLDEE
ncbi:MAG TPA: PilZ domain-containing protein [Pseudomonas xinjiangensis]|uniref:PilZ domain-containing protein n=2 Tax=root TaxID=1 RepID=A0A7V1BRW0_9GAMM|nr:PilZ domain-containing protein [Halopseudomonas xinjiangensis]HEC47279.1 PilZ domain-containing protein [Halopseudomonas xinjiangensis]